MKDPLTSENAPEYEKIEQIRERVIHSIAQNIDLYGITPSIGRLYGAMYFRDQPMTLDEMSDALSMSKTSMSTGVRSLLEINMVRKIWQKGVRKDLYAVEEDWYTTFIELFTTKWRKGIEMNEHELRRAKNELELLCSPSPNDPVNRVIATDLKKIQHALDYYKWLTMLVESFESGQIFDFIPKPDHEQT